MLLQKFIRFSHRNDHSCPKLTYCPKHWRFYFGSFELRTHSQVSTHPAARSTTPSIAWATWSSEIPVWASASFWVDHRDTLKRLPPCTQKRFRPPHKPAKILSTQTVRALGAQIRALDALLDVYRNILCTNALTAKCMITYLTISIHVSRHSGPQSIYSVTFLQLYARETMNHKRTEQKGSALWKVTSYSGTPLGTLFLYSKPFD